MRPVLELRKWRNRPRKAWFLLCFALWICMIPYKTAWSKPIPEKKAVWAVIGEAENQGPLGMLYVSCAIRNRGTLRGVYGLHSVRVVMGKYSAQIALAAKRAWEESENPDVCLPIKGARFWENTGKFGVPYWAKGMQVVFVYRNHQFFK